MDEVDRIIFHSLKQIDCDIDEGVAYLGQFTTEMIVEAVVKCLRLIKPGFEMSHRLPPEMMTRFRVGSSLAKACTDLGYSGEIGYQTFLYWSEADIRRVLMFLIEKLPKESEKTSDEPLGASTILKRKIAEEIKRQLLKPWLPAQLAPPFATLGEDFREAVSFKTSSSLVNPTHLEDVTVPVTKELRTFYNQFMEVITNQPSCRETGLSCFIGHNATQLAQYRDLDLDLDKGSRALKKEDFRLQKKKRIDQRMRGIVAKEIQKSAALTNAFDVPLNFESASSSVKDSRFRLIEKLVYTKGADGSARPIGDPAPPSSSSSSSSYLSESKESLKERQRQEEEAAKARIREREDELADLATQSKKLNGGINQLEEQLATRRRANEELSEVFELKKTAFELLPEADANLAKLEAVVEATAQRLLSLAAQWENHRGPLVDQYRRMREMNANRVSETRKKLEEIVDLRERMKEISEEARTKEEIHKQLISEYEKMTRDLNRSAYTRRILEIVTNIKKQKRDIDKVLIDTKEVQKEINQLSGKLERTFTVTDELIFKDAKKDNAVRKAYKYLAALHDNCCQLVKTVEETGIIMREIRDLEDQIENESQRKVLANLGRIMADYQQMKRENNALLAKLTPPTPSKA